MKLRGFFFGPSTPKVVTRIAPSPTGFLHMGTARTALFNYLYARKLGGKFLMRIEDTDTARNKPEFEQSIYEGLAWLGIKYDAQYKQSERNDVYVRYLEQLIKSGKAYASKEESKNEPGKEVEVIRLKNPGRKISFMDEIRGKIEFDTAELGDFVIARNMREPLYHLAVVVDDHEMGITHVIRGEDHISNTPRQILIQEALGFKRPIYAHLPLILAPDRSKMSKRHGAVSIEEYRNQGFIPEGFLNYLAFLGWNPGTDQELFTLEELVKAFDLSHVQKGGAVFDMEKLKWFNREHIKRLPDEILLKHLEEMLPKGESYDRELLKRAVPTLFERVSTLAELKEQMEKGEFSYLFSRPTYEPSKLFWKEDQDKVATAKRLKTVREFLDTISASAFSAQAIKDAIFEYATREGRGSVLWPMRVALSGRDKSPDPFVLGAILGKEETLARISLAEQALA